MLELMICLTVLVAALGAIYSATIQHSATRRVVEETALAFQASRNTLEQLRSLEFSTLPSMHGTGFDTPAMDGSAGGLNPLPGDPDGLPGLVLITTDQSSGGETIYRARALVEWSGSSGSRSFELSTLIARRHVVP
jgi:hypothetical protein